MVSGSIGKLSVDPAALEFVTSQMTHYNDNHREMADIWATLFHP